MAFKDNFYFKTIKKHIVFLVLILILLFSFVTKVWNVSHPQAYVFDEVYVGFTAEEFARNNPKAWVWDYPSPKGYAYCWSHPQLGKLIMAGFIKVLGFGTFSRRIASVLAGVGITLMVYLLSKQLFPKQPLLWLSAAFLISLDGLILTLSRIGLADSMLCLFLLTAVYFLIKKKFLFSSLFWGMAVGIKWSALYFLPLLGLVLLTYQSWSLNFRIVLINSLRIWGIISRYLLIGAGVYLLSYLPLFLYGYGFQKFIDLQKQMFWYHTRLNATHPFQSPAISWPFDWRPVWFWVDYQETTIANIYALGNPLIFWAGLLAVFFTIGFAILSLKKSYYYLIFAYFTFWLPWIRSPRIMFLYHYTPALPYLCIMLAFMIVSLTPNKKLRPYIVGGFLMLTFIVFWFFYPYWTGIPVPKDQVSRFQWFKTWQ